MKNPWIRYGKRKKDADIRLFCLPYAGAGATIYARWDQFFSSKIAVCPVALPGREQRSSEPHIDNAQRLAQMIFEGIKGEIDTPYAIFGHSMGGIISYELTKKICESGMRKPEVLFLSGTALHFPEDRKQIYKLSDDAFAKHLIEMGGTYETLVNMEKFRQCFFPILRNDYKLAETYQCSEQRLPCKIHGFAGTKDQEILNEYTLQLKNYTDNFELTYYNGGHFFINEFEKEVCQKIEAVLLGNKEINDIWEVTIHE